MKIARTTRLFRGQLDLAPFLCVIFPVAFVAVFHSYLVLPHGTRLVLPSVDSGPVVKPGEAMLVVAVDAARRLYFENQLVSPATLETALQRRIQSGGPTLLLIQADTTVPYGHLADLVTLARRTGVKEAVFSALPARR